MRKSVERQPVSKGSALTKCPGRDGQAFPSDHEAGGATPFKGRICLLTSNFPRWPGDSTTPFVLHLAQDLMDLGWQVDVLAPHAPGARRSEILNGVPVYRFRYLWPESRQTLCYQGGALVNLRAHRSNWLKVPALVAFEWLALCARLLRCRYDLISAHWILPQGFVAVLAGRLLRIPVVVTVHGGDVFGLRGKISIWFKRMTLRGARTVTVNSSATLEAVREIDPNYSRVQRIPIGANFRVAAPEPQPAKLRSKYRSGAGPLLIFVGRLVPEKGIGDLIRAVSYLDEPYPDISVMVVGEGPARHDTEGLAADLGIAQRVHFIGWVAPELLPNYLKAADIFVGPSKRAADGWVEAQGLTFVEAMIAGTPVIATRSGGIGDVVRHEETGLLVPEGDPEAIARSVGRLAKDPDLAARLAKAGYELAIHDYTRSASAQSFSELFASVRRSACGGNAS